MAFSGFFLLGNIILNNGIGVVFSGIVFWGSLCIRILLPNEYTIRKTIIGKT